MKRLLTCGLLALCAVNLSCKTTAHDDSMTSGVTAGNGRPAWSRIPPEDFSMPPPPAANSQAFKKDFEELLTAQDTRTEEDCQTSKRQQYPSFKTLFESSPILSEAEFQKDEALFDRALNLAEKVAGHFKDQYKRPRPYTTNPDIKPCVPLISGNKSYPSSHATMASMGTCLIAKQFPSRSDAAEKYGRYLAELRVKIGVHHPSDVSAGIKLGKDVCARLLRDAEFVAAFRAIEQH